MEQMMPDENKNEQGPQKRSKGTYKNILQENGVRPQV
jgi:hypothetical protein